MLKSPSLEEFFFPFTPQEKVFLLQREEKIQAFTPIEKGMYLSPSVFRKISLSFWEDFFARYPLVFIAISFSFSKDLLLNRESTQRGFFLVPVEETSPPSYLPYPKRLFLSIPFLREEFKKVYRKIYQAFVEGEFYLINYSFPAFLQVVELKYKEPFFSKAGGYFPLPDRSLYSFSPEVFLEIQGDFIHTFPIKGTLQEKESKELLLEDPKEHHEHTMVVDLLRNDIGRISTPGSVEVPTFKGLYRHKGLYQMYSHIKGKLSREFLPPRDLIPLLPAGSISGCPKKRVVEFLEKEEPWDRGFYTGIAGVYHAQRREGYFTILIRTLEVFSWNKVFLGVGAGLTVESNPEKEYQEFLYKIESTLKSFIEEEANILPEEDSLKSSL